MIHIWLFQFQFLFCLAIILVELFWIDIWKLLLNNIRLLWRLLNFNKLDFLRGLQKLLNQLLLLLNYLRWRLSILNWYIFIFWRSRILIILFIYLIINKYILSLFRCIINILLNLILTWKLFLLLKLMRAKLIVGSRIYVLWKRCYQFIIL